MLIRAAAMTARIDIMKGFSWKIQRITGFFYFAPLKRGAQA
jgi:hypothetical protein